MWRKGILFFIFPVFCGFSVLASDTITFKKAYALYSGGEYAACKNMLADLEKQNSSYAPVYYYLALIYQQENNLPDAEAYFRKSISCDPKFAPAYSDFAILKYQLKDYEQAKASAKKAITLDPKFVKAYINLSSIFYKLGDLNAAKAYVSEAAKLDVIQVINLGDMFLKKFANPDMALFYYDAAIGASDHQPLALTGMGMVYKLKGNNETAYKFFKKAYEDTPANHQYFEMCYNSFFSFLFETQAYQIICSKVFEKVDKGYTRGYFYYSLAAYKLNLVKEFRLGASMYFELQKKKLPESLEYWAEEQLHSHI